MSKLAITLNKGFHLTFDNGLKLSVQIGTGNYCDNYSPFGRSPTKEEVLPCGNAEIALWNKAGAWFSFGDDEVLGYVSIERILDLIAYLRTLPTDDFSTIQFDFGSGE